jgi:diadenosine tetraphosphate (Ap4A) HIT family hydrolase
VGADATSCAICRGRDGDAELDRIHVWEDDLWRLSMSTSGPTTGFAYLEPRRHIPYVTDLDGAEAATFGTTLARVSSVLKEASGADLVWLYVFGGGIPHLHVHLAPHREGDALNAQIVRGEIVEEKLPSGATRVSSRDFPDLPAAELRAVIERTAELLAGVRGQNK